MPVFRFRLKIDLTLLVISNLAKLTLFITREFARFLADGLEYARNGKIFHFPLFKIRRLHLLRFTFPKFMFLIHKSKRVILIYKYKYKKTKYMNLCFIFIKIKIKRGVYGYE